MTNAQIEIAIQNGQKVCAGKRGSEDYDEGRVMSYDAKAAIVAWQSGVRTPCPKKGLRLVK